MCFSPGNYPSRETGNLVLFLGELPITRSVFDETERETGNYVLFPGELPITRSVFNETERETGNLVPGPGNCTSGPCFFIIRARKIFALAGRYKRGDIYEA